MDKRHELFDSLLYDLHRKQKVERIFNKILGEFLSKKLIWRKLEVKIISFSYRYLSSLKGMFVQSRNGTPSGWVQPHGVHLKKIDVFMLISTMCHFLWADAVICLSSQLSKHRVGWISSPMAHHSDTLLKSTTSKTKWGTHAWIIQLSNIPSYITAKWLKKCNRWSFRIQRTIGAYICCCWVSI